MSLGDINVLILFFFIILLSVVVNVNTSLHLLLTAEFLWITLYAITMVSGLIYDNLNLVSLTFLFLVLSAAEFGIGLIIIVVQNVITRSINLNDNSKNFLKFNNRFLKKININYTNL